MALIQLADFKSVPDNGGDKVYLNDGQQSKSDAVLLYLDMKVPAMVATGSKLEQRRVLRNLRDKKKTKNRGLL